MEIMKLTNKKYFLLIAALVISSFAFLADGGDNESVLLKEDFQKFRVGMFSVFVKAFNEYHYLPENAPKFGWSVSTHEGEVGSQRAWWIFEEDGKKLMTQTYDNPDNWTHPIVIAGDSLWTNYTLTVSFLPESEKKQSGVLFRYQNDRCYYFFGVNNGKAILKMVKHATAYHTPFERILAEEKYIPQPGKYITVNVKVNGNEITASIDGKLTLKANDVSYSTGKIGLMSDVPAKFSSV